jgi:nucleoside-diphosphate-sugar epimerase
MDQASERVAMNLIVAGATGFVGSEVIRLSLKRPDITTVIALSRTPIPLPQQPEGGADVSKLRNVIIKDYGDYPDSVKKEFAGADR